MEQEQDRYLVKALLDGNSDAWDEVASCIEGWLKHASRRHYIPAEDINDLKQDILTKLIENNYKNLQGFSFRCRLSIWIGSVVNNHLFDHYRSEIRRERRNYGFENFRKDFENDLKDMDLVIEQIDASEKVEKAIESLSPSERRLIRMLYWDNLKPTEIARLVGERAATVTSRLARAKARLKEALMPTLKDKGEKAI